MPPPGWRLIYHSLKNQYFRNFAERLQTCLILKEDLANIKVSVDKVGSKESSQKLIQGIMGYLIQYPEAKDTVEGVMEWWVTKGQTNYRREEVEAVLDGLVAKGWIMKRPPTESLYSLNKERVAEIRQFLRK